MECILIHYFPTFMKRMNTAMYIAVSLLLYVVSVHPSYAFLANYTTLRINCGGGEVLENGLSWSSDKYFDGGVAYNPPNQPSNSSESSLRAFDFKSCYNVPIVEGRFLVRLGFSYANYDQLNSPPTFILTINDVVVLDTALGLSSLYNDSMAYSEFFVFVSNTTSILPICFLPKTNKPIVNTLEVVAVDTLAYKSRSGFVLSTLRRVNVGGTAVTKEPFDTFARRWEKDAAYIFGKSIQVNTSSNINGSNISPDYIPNEVVSTGRTLNVLTNSTGNVTANSVLTFTTQLSPLNSYNSWMIRLHFAEFNRTAKNGTRVFKLDISNGAISRTILVDIFEEVQAVDTALKKDFVVIRDSLYSWPTLTLTFSKLDGFLPPILNGVEVMEFIPLTSNLENYRRRSGSDSHKIPVVVLSSLSAALLIIILIFACLIYKKKKNARLNASSPPASSDSAPVTTRRTPVFSSWFGNQSRYEKSVHGEFNHEVQLANTQSS